MQCSVAHYRGTLDWAQSNKMHHMGGAGLLLPDNIFIRDLELWDAVSRADKWAEVYLACHSLLSVPATVSKRSLGHICSVF